MSNQPAFAFSTALLPKEETLEVGRKNQSLYIGLPKETKFQEKRIALIPDAVGLLVNNGHRVVIESGAGLHSNFSDREYSEAGAEIKYDTSEVYKADIVLKIAPPSLEEIEMMQRKQVLFSALQLSVQPDDFLKCLLSKKVSAIAFDFIRDKEGVFPFVRSMSEIAGYASVLIAAEYLSNARDGRGMILGGVSGIPPTRVVILGAGTVGEFATRAALGLGATVKVFDDSLYKLSRLQNDIGQRIYTSIIQPHILAEDIRTADVVIGAVRSRSGRSPILVTEQMIRNMKPGGVVVDVCIDQGGCFETSEVTNHSKPTFVKHDITHFCVPNIASRVSKTASNALSNLFTPILIKMGENGGFEGMVRNDRGLRNGIYLFNGILTNKYLGDTYKIPYKDINLLMSVF
jgi:alanine dehydrogenase